MSDTLPLMPWEIIQLPFRNGVRAYKRYPDGITIMASPEEEKIWAAVEALRSQQNRPSINGDSNATEERIKPEDHQPEHSHGAASGQKRQGRRRDRV